jgi:hypothetical protein
MRFAWPAFVVIGCLIVAVAAFTNLGAQEEPKLAPNAEPPRERIVPVVALKPGEAKELLLSTVCTLFTRGGGLHIRDLDGGVVQNERTVWKSEGITVEVPEMGEAAKEVAAPIYAPLKDKGLSAFVVKVSASKEAKPGLVNLHIADTTCNGTCDTDFRVLVVAP